MVLEAEVKIVQSKNAHTQYLVIPSVMVQDSHYPFKGGERVKITIDPYRKMMIITSVEEPQIKVSPDGIHIKGKKIIVEK
jgi:hypothetical protein